jgi:hypothetical protein
MRIPKLLRFINIRDVLVENGYGTEAVDKMFAILRSINGDVIVMPKSSTYAVNPYIRIKHNDLSVKFYLNRGIRLEDFLNGKSSIPLVGGGHVSIRNNKLVIESSDEGKELIFNNIYIIQAGDKAVVIGRHRKKAFVIDPFTSDIINVKSCIHCESEVFAALAWNEKDGCRIVVIDKYSGNLRVYSLGDLGSVKDVRCGYGLAFIRFSGQSFVADFEGIRSVDGDFAPFLTCGNYQYLLDREHGILIRLGIDSLEPLAMGYNVRLLGCLDEGDLAALINSRPAVMRDNVWSYLGQQSISKGAAGGKTVLLNTGDLSIVFYDGAKVAELRTIKCTVLGDGFVACLTSEGIAIMDPSATYEVSIDVVREVVDSNGYAEVILRPWFEGMKYSISQSIQVIHEKIKDSELILNLRPKVLGWEGYGIIAFSSPLHTLMQRIRVRSKHPKLSRAEVIKCKYSTEGKLDDGESNASITIALTIYNSLPENANLSIKSSKIKLTNVGKYVLKPGVNELEVTITGYALEDNVDIQLNYLWDRGNIPLGELMINLKRYLIRNPLSGIKPTIRSLGECIAEIRYPESIYGELLCRNGVKVSGKGSVMVRNCELPAVLTLMSNYEGFKFVKFVNIDYLAQPGTEFTFSKSPGTRVEPVDICFEGFALQSPKIVTSLNPGDFKIAVTPLIGNGAPLLRVVASAPVDSLLYIITGRRTYTSLGTDIILDVSNLDIFQGLVGGFISIGNLSLKFHLSGTEVLKSFIRLGSAAAASLLKLVGFGG